MDLIDLHLSYRDCPGTHYPTRVTCPVIHHGCQDDTRHIPSFETRNILMPDTSPPHFWGVVACVFCIIVSSVIIWYILPMILFYDTRITKPLAYAPGIYSDFACPFRAF